jgi:fatty acid desaturase
MATTTTTQSHNGQIPDVGGPDNPLHRLSEEQIEQLGREFEALHEQVMSDLGDRDAKYIRSVIGLQRRLALIARLELIASRWRIPWTVGAVTLGLAKILENMEIGHNVLHGQWDWMNDPVINSRAWDWDTASTAEAWRHSHNYVHHTFTNILGKDRDLGYEIMRIDPQQSWHPVYLLQPLYNIALMALFEWGVAVHDLDFTAIRAGEKSMKQVRRELRGILGKARSQIRKDYMAWPVLSGLVMTAVDAGLLALSARQNTSRAARTRARAERLGRRLRRKKPAGGRELLRRLVERRSFRGPFIRTLTADAAANVIRNVWSYAIIFCGHFPDQTYTFTQEETADETRGGWYVRQLTGAANIDGGPLFHVLSGNLGYQVEHHLFPDMPSTRYGEIAPKVREICMRYGLPYNSGPFHQQLGMVQRTIIRLAFPGGRARPKPGAYAGPLVRGKGERDGATAAGERDGATAAGERDGATAAGDRDGATAAGDRDGATAAGADR